MSFFKPGSGSDVPEKGNEALPEDESRVLDKLAGKVVEKGMTVPAILFLESVKPLNFIGSQAMVFFEPIVQTVFNIKDYDTLRQALEKRQTIEILLQKIEALDAVALGAREAGQGVLQAGEEEMEMVSEIPWGFPAQSENTGRCAEWSPAR